MDSFDFQNKRIDEALREILVSFRLPGESQPIERILETFASKYMNSSPPNIADADSAFVLSYSVIMLNTDQHNKQVRHRMTFDDFSRNLRGTNKGTNYARDYLEAIFAAVRSREIVMPEEQNNFLGYEHAWKELQQKSETAGTLVICDTNLYDELMFTTTWKPVVAALGYVFASATDDAVFSRVIRGLDQLMDICGQYRAHDTIDHIILLLSRISALNEPTASKPSRMAEVTAGDIQITVSDLSVQFGSNFKAQLACLVLFSACRKGRQSVIRNGWSVILQILLNLFASNLLPSSLSPINQFVRLPPIPHKIIVKNRVTDQSKDSGLFSTLTSYLSGYNADEAPPPTNDELESSLSALDCINTCNFEEICRNILSINLDASVYLFNFLYSFAKERAQDANPAKEYRIKDMFALELLSCVAMKDQKHTERFGYVSLSEPLLNLDLMS